MRQTHISFIDDRSSLIVFTCGGHSQYRQGRGKLSRLRPVKIARPHPSGTAASLVDAADRLAGCEPI